MAVFDESGRLTLEINYKDGRKHGERISYLPNEKIVELFEVDVKQGATKYFNADNNLVLTVPSKMASRKALHLGLQVMEE